MLLNLKRFYRGLFEQMLAQWPDSMRERLIDYHLRSWRTGLREATNQDELYDEIRRGGETPDVPLLVLTVVLLRGQAWVLGRRGYTVVGGKSGDPRLIRLRWLKGPALALCFAVLLCPVFLPYGALFNATLSRVPSQLLSLDTITLHNIYFVFFELSATKVALKNTFLLGVMAATAGTVTTSSRCRAPSSASSPRRRRSAATTPAGAARARSTRNAMERSQA